MARSKPLVAKQELACVDIDAADDHARTCLLATQGIIEYRLGNPDEGLRLYREAIALAEKSNELKLKATAQMYLAREEAFAGRTTYVRLFENALKEVVRINDELQKAVANNIHSEIVEFTKQKDAAAPKNTSQREG